MPREPLQRKRWNVVTIIVVLTAISASLAYSILSPSDHGEHSPHYEDSVVVYPPYLQCAYPPAFENTTVDGVRVCNVTGTLIAVQHMRADELRWAGLTARIQVEYGHMPHGFERILVDAQPFMPRPITLPAVPTVFYEDRAGSPDEIDEGDIIGVVGVTVGCQDALVVIPYGHQGVIDVFYIPAREGLRLELSEYDISVPYPPASMWDATTTVRMVEPQGERIEWDSLWLLEEHTQTVPELEPWPGEAGASRTAVHYYYQDVGSADGAVSQGDIIRCTGVSMGWAQTQRRIYAGGTPVAGFYIPYYFPSPLINVTLGGPVMTSRMTSCGPVCDLRYAVTDMAPAGMSIAWPSFQVRVIHLDSYTHDLLNVTPIPLPATPSVPPYAYYEEVGTNDGRLSVGDAIIVSGVDVSFAGGHVALVLDGAMMGGRRIPDVMPGSSSTLEVYLKESDRRVVGGSSVWDVKMFIHPSLNPRSVVIPWSEVDGMLVPSVTGSAIGPVRLAAYEGQTPSTTTIYYDDSPSNDSIISNRDLIIVASTGVDLGGATIYLEWRGLVLGDGVLPPDLMSSDLSAIELDLGTPVVEYAPHEGTDLWRLTVNVTRVAPSDLPLPWQSTSIFMYNSSGAPMSGENKSTGYGSVSSIPWHEYTSMWPRLVHLDTASGDRNVTVGDAIGAVGLPASCAGGRIDVYVDGRLVASVDLPTIIPRT